MKDYAKELEELVTNVVKSGASDLHLSVGRHPTLRVSGSLVPLFKKPTLIPEDIAGFADVLLNEKQMKKLEQGETDFAYTSDKKVRFRCNAFKQRGFFGIAMRFIPSVIKTLEELNLPADALRPFALKQQGFFLVVGPTGHGKSTTVAAMVDIINHETSNHIVTIEDPVEYLFAQDKSIIVQREVNHDTETFSSGLRAMFRQDVDVAMIGEMRDLESIAIAVTAAETGHLILSSLHTNNASQTIDRIIDSFPAAQQNQIRLQLAGSLLGIFSQRLVPCVVGGLVPAYELLIVNTAVANLIREARTHEIDIVIETSSSQGMISLNSSLINLVREGIISMENALIYSLKPGVLTELSK